MNKFQCHLDNPWDTIHRRIQYNVYFIISNLLTNYFWKANVKWLKWNLRSLKTHRKQKEGIWHLRKYVDKNWIKKLIFLGYQSCKEKNDIYYNHDAFHDKYAENFWKYIYFFEGEGWWVMIQLQWVLFTNKKCDNLDLKKQNTWRESFW